jgi:hypothetical protein
MNKRWLWSIALLALPMCHPSGSGEVPMNNYVSDDIPKLRQAAYESNVAAYQNCG